MNTNAKTEDYIEAGKSKLSDTMDDMTNRLTKVTRNVTETAKNVSAATDEYVHENPWKAIAVVALAACVVGWFINAARD